MNINQIMESHGVTRWHKISMAREQSLAEHMYLVCMLARHLHHLLEGENTDDTEVIKLALEHDLDEVLYGDFPRPTKIELGIDIPYNGKGRSVRAHVIVKLADLMEATWYLNNYAGNNNSRIELEKLKQDLRKHIEDIFIDPQQLIIRKVMKELNIL